MAGVGTARSAISQYEHPDWLELDPDDRVGHFSDAGRSRHGALQRPDADLSPGARQEGPVRAHLHGPPMSADSRIG
jgi:hypothetical protein